MNMHNFLFLTSNIQKAKDLTNLGINVKKFSIEIPEILSDDVEDVVLYKAKDTELNNILVEDTALYVEGAHFLGTEIKHVYEEIKNDLSFHDRKAIWKVSICLRKDDEFYISTGVLEGKLSYPELDYGYHFNKLLSVDIYKDNNYRVFETLTNKEKILFGPRFIAVNQLKEALSTGDFKKVKVINMKDVKEWDGEYQVEKVKPNKSTPCFSLLKPSL